MRTFRKISFWTSVALLFLVLLGAAVYLVFQDEEPPLPDQDLKLSRRQVADGANGFISVNFGRDEVFWPDDDEYLQGVSDNFGVAAAAENLEKNAAILHRFDESFGYPDFQVPS